MLFSNIAQIKQFYKKFLEIDLSGNRNENYIAYELNVDQYVFRKHSQLKHYQLFQGLALRLSLWELHLVAELLLVKN